MRFFKRWGIGALMACFATGCAVVTFPTEPLPVARSAEGGLQPAPFTFLIDTSYRHFDNDVLNWTGTALPADTLLAWGRYPINRAGKSAENNGYKELTVSELERFRTTRMRLLPIIAPPQQTLKLDEQAGRLLAAESADQIVHLFGGWGDGSNPQSVLLFLDVEGDANPISEAFLRGWCEQLKSRHDGPVSFLPAVYTSALGSTSVRRAISQVNGSCHIEGLWLARYLKTWQRPAVWPDFHNSTRKDLIPFPDDVPIYAWQYWSRESDPKVDVSLVNPSLIATLESYALHLHSLNAATNIGVPSTDHSSSER